MPITTNVPAPTFGPTGFVAPTEAAILAGVQADINAAFGGNLNPALNTPQGQLASSETAIIGDNYATFIYYTNQVDPALNSGRMQDAIGRIYFMQRIAAAPTTQSCTCTGLNGVTIPVGALAEDQNDVLWISQNSGEIVNGSVTLSFACVNNGPIAGPTSMTIYQAVFGWDTIAPSGEAVLGNNVESASAFEARRAASVAVNADGILDAILGAVLAVPDVLDAYVVENDNSYPITIQGVTLGSNSIYVAVLGGAAQAVANAIWSRKAPGCGYNGNTTETVLDPNPNYVAPIPSYQVSFEIPSIEAFAVLIVLQNNSSVPSNAQVLCATAVIAAFAGTDGGTRAGIGSTVFASRLYSGIASLGTWVNIVYIQVGLSGQAASFTAAIGGTSMVVSAVSSGTLAVGQLVQDGPGNVSSGTTIVNQVSGTTGGIGTYTVSMSQSVLSEAMTATTLANDVQLNLNEAPSIVAGNVQLALVTA